jgi:phosphohistidine phosphatase
MQKATAGMRALGLEFDVILTSPLPRAAETAAIVAAVCGKEPAPRELAALAPGAAASIMPALRPFARRSHVMLVGHEPGLSQLASLLLTGSNGGMALDLKKGGCIAIELAKLTPPTGATLRWVLTPKQLRQLG